MWYNSRRHSGIAAFAQIAADVILDYLNVTLFHGGMFGMAMATVISVYLYILLMLVPCFTRAGYRFSLRFFSFAELAQICGFGLLYLVYKACVAFMNLFLNRLLSSRGGVHYVTANSIIFSVELLIGAFPSGFGSTTHMLIGMEKEQVQKYFRDDIPETAESELGRGTGIWLTRRLVSMMSAS